MVILIDYTSEEVVHYQVSDNSREGTTHSKARSLGIKFVVKGEIIILKTEREYVKKGMFVKGAMGLNIVPTRFRMMENAKVTEMLVYMK